MNIRAQTKKAAAVLLATLILLLLTGCSLDSKPDSSHAAQNTSLAPCENELKVYCFSAGKADAQLIYTKDHAVLIDCGEKGFGKEITAFMEDIGVTSLDYLIITHFDKDHVGGAAKVIRSVEVKNVLQSNCPKDSEEYSEYLAQLSESGITAQTVTEDTAFTAGDISFTVNAPDRDTYEDDPSNNSSLITAVEYGESRLLFAGDAQEDRLKEFTAENTTDYDYLKVPYHGSRIKGMKDFLESTKPKIAVITCSDDEPESKKTVSQLEAQGCEIYLTREAPVAVKSDGETLTVIELTD